ncbi:G-type lectin S-receptor-like serine/threonine-protein kinase [Tanacetum coccineum]
MKTNTGRANKRDLMVVNETQALISYNQVDSSVISKSTVNSSGHLERLAWLEDKKIWEVIVTLPKDTRDTYKKCGAYGSCSNADAETLCLCLDEKIFKPVNKESWEIGDSAGGCVRRIPLDCKSGTNGFINSGNSQHIEAAYNRLHAASLSSS